MNIFKSSKFSLILALVCFIGFIFFSFIADDAKGLREEIFWGILTLYWTIDGNEKRKEGL